MEMLIVGIIVWGGLCAYMAQNRGRNWILGVIGGTLFGPLAVIYYWIVGDTQDLKDDKEIKRMKRMKALMKEGV